MVLNLLNLFNYSPALAPTYELLVSILEFVNPSSNHAQSSSSLVSVWTYLNLLIIHYIFVSIQLPQHRLKDLTMALASSCPFGLINSTDLQRLRKIMKAASGGSEYLPCDLDNDTKGVNKPSTPFLFFNFLFHIFQTPFFRPIFPADRENVSALLVERISSVQTADCMLTNISGCCWLCVELTSASPNVTIPVNLPEDEENALHLYVSPHSSVETDNKQSPQKRNRRTLNMSVVPPNDWFPLFLYEARDSPEPPVFGSLIVRVIYQWLFGLEKILTFLFLI